MEEGRSFSGSAYPPDEMLLNCSVLSHCTSDQLSASSISCSFVWDVAPPVQKYAPYVAAVEAVFFAISFCWNLIIIVNFITRKKMLNLAAGVYLLNVAITDFMFSIFVVFQCLLAESAKYFFIGGTDIIRCRICEFLGFMVMFLLTNTLHTLAVLSFDRFFLFMKPMKYAKYFTWKTAVVIMAFVWMLCLGLALPPLFGLGEYDFSTVIANCHPMWLGPSKLGIPNLSYIIIIAIEALIPITVLIVTNICNVRIILKSIKERHKRRIANESVSHSSNMEEVSSNIRTESSRKQKQVAKVFGAFFIAHICCWTPVLTVLVAAVIVGPGSVPAEVYVVGWMFFLTNPVVHPIIETYFIKYLRTRIMNRKKQLCHSITSRTSIINLMALQKLNKRTQSFVEPRNTRHLEATNTGAKLRHSQSFIDRSTPFEDDVKATQPGDDNLNAFQKSQLILPIESRETVFANFYEVSVTMNLPCTSSQ